MKIDAPFLYRAVIVRPRRRSEETVTLLGYERIEIPELSAAEAPIAACYRTAAGTGVTPGRVPTDYRFDGAALMRPLQMRADTFSAVNPLPKTTANLANLKGHLDAWARLCLAMGRGGGLATSDRIYEWSSDFSRSVGGPIETEHGLEFRRLVSDSRAASAERLRAAMLPGRGIAFVDGVLHQRSEGPCWVVNPDHNDARVRSAVQVDAERELGALSDRAMLFAYGATRHADAVAAAREYALAARKPFLADGTRTCSAEPGAPAQRDQALALLAAARLTEDWMAETVGKMPSNVIRVYADFKDAIKAASSNPDGPLAETLLPLLRDIDACWARSGIGHVAGIHNPLRNFELRGVADRAAADIPEFGIAELEALGHANHGAAQLT